MAASWDSWSLVTMGLWADTEDGWYTRAGAEAVLRFGPFEVEVHEDGHDDWRLSLSLAGQVALVQILRTHYPSRKEAVRGAETLAIQVASSIVEAAHRATCRASPIRPG